MATTQEIRNAQATRAALEAKSRMRFLETGRGWLESHEWRELIKAERVLLAAGMIQAHQPIWSE